MVISSTLAHLSISIFACLLIVSTTSQVLPGYSRFNAPRIQGSFIYPGRNLPTSTLPPTLIESNLDSEAEDSEAYDLAEEENDNNPVEKEAPNSRASSNNMLTFGDLENNDCTTVNKTYYEVVNDEMMQCQKITEQKCYSSQETIFKVFKTEVCDETFTKSCYISFSEETSKVLVTVCYNKANKVCDNELVLRTDNQVCVNVTDTICDTFHRQATVEEDVVNCTQIAQEVCNQRDGCPTVPKTSCTLSKQTVSKDYPETQCKKVEKEICGPDSCPIRFLPQICTNETKMATSTIPIEKCDLTPKKECRDITTLVPGLKAIEKCIDLPKEVCSKVSVPRKVTKTSVKVTCPPLDIVSS